ncbi:g167 [Coccomyxa viridis]|uniref:G167 protein n=1 Tax=Coccomyxa viridis TaxID=1274662 RepID=A0ABP1FI13_9CHLO
MDPRRPGLPQYDPRIVGEEGMSRGQLAGQYGLLPGHTFPMQARHLQPENDYGIGVRELAMPPMGPPYLPGYNHLSTEQQLADLFSSQLELLGSPLNGAEESSAQQEGEEKPRSKMQEKNRRAQRRFRERQKTKFIELNTRVEELEGVIGELLSEKTRLEDRTSFLEKALECRSSSSESNLSAMPRSGSQDVPELQGAAQLGTQLPASASGGALALPAGINPEDIAEGSIRFFHDDLCLSIPFKGEHFMSIDAIKALTPRELILLYERYVEQLRRCLLLEASEQPNANASMGVVKLANEISTLLLRSWALNPVLMRQLFQQLNGTDRVTQAVYARVADMLEMSMEQRLNFVAVNKTFQARRKVLLDQRQSIYGLMQRPTTRYNNAEDIIVEFLKAHDAMNTLKSNLRQEHWESLSWASTCHQLLTPWQMATLLVETHPQWYDLCALSNALEERETKGESRGALPAPASPL